MSPRQTFVAIFAVFMVVAGLAVSGSLIEFNDNGQYQILQTVSGDLRVINKAGPYWQGMGTVTSYPYADTVHFSNRGEKGADAAPEVRFSDNGTAKISGFLQYAMPRTPEEQIALHRTYTSYENFKANVVRRLYPAALIQTASLMRTEESYSSRRSEFRTLSQQQLESGLVETTSSEVRQTNAEGNDFIERITRVKLDDKGKAVIGEPSPFKLFGIDVIAFTVNEIDFDPSVDALFAKKKEAEQQKVVARANAERAKQDAITAEEQGKAKVAVAKAEKEVEKIAAVTTAQKEAEVAAWDTKRDAQLAQATLIKAKAEAEGNRLKVAAGLTPLERAEIKMKTAIGVATELAKLHLPGTMVFGGGGKDSPTNPFDAIGLEAYMNITEKLAAKE